VEAGEKMWATDAVADLLARFKEIVVAKPAHVGEEGDGGVFVAR